MGKIITKNGFFSFEEIKNNITSPMEEYEQETIKFCREWLNGKEKFTLFTSGSTGRPKPVELTREQMQSSALATAQALNLKKGDIALVALNTAYIAGIMMLVRGMIVDMDLLLVPAGASPVREIKAGTKIDFTALVPLQLQTLLEENDPKDIHLLESMKAIIVGGAAVSAALEEKIQHLHSPVYSTYGMTETVSHIALRRLNGKEKRPYYTTLPGVAIDTDERGCLKILSFTTHQQWLQTNDLVEILDTDKFYWLGRADHMINSGGVKIQPEKIEALLEQVMYESGIRHFFVASLPHPLLGEAVTLFVEGKEKLQNLPEKIRPLLTPFEIPKAILYSEVFPRSATGKIEKLKVVEKFKDHYSSS